MSILAVKNLKKSYRTYPNGWARLKDWFQLSGKPTYAENCILNDITFSVMPGEAVGIIGLNGSGKSTLLKIIAGISKPTSGSVAVTGRVAAILELGMGFDPDFTGRENVMIAGQLLGNSSGDMVRLMPQITNFAGLDNYIDKKLRVYSSGMQVRLAFSVATAFRPDILIIDEALSVGDEFFQHKCFDRIRAYRAQGMTLLIVSHDKQAITTICDRAILLDRGRMALVDKPERVLDYYNALLATDNAKNIEVVTDEIGNYKMESGSGEAVIAGVTLIDDAKNSTNIVKVGGTYCLHVMATTKCSIESLVLGYTIKDKFGQIIYGTNTYHTSDIIRNVPAMSKLNFNFDIVMNLSPGLYSLGLALVDGRDHLSKNYHWIDRALIFNVINNGVIDFIGLVRLESKVSITIS